MLRRASAAMHCGAIRCNALQHAEQGFRRDLAGGGQVRRWAGGRVAYPRREAGRGRGPRLLVG